MFTSTNAAGANAVLAFSRAPNGELSAAGSFATGGAGTGSPLDSQGALAFDRDDSHRLFVVNAGSNSISEFAVERDGLTLLSTVSSGGAEPVSLAVNHDLLYVLNEGDSGSPGNISGFLVGDRTLTPIPGSTRPLSAAAVSAPEISFTPSGDVLVVTEEATNLIDTYNIGRDGRADGPVSHASAARRRSASRSTDAATSWSATRPAAPPAPGRCPHTWSRGAARWPRSMARWQTISQRRVG